MSAHGHDSAQDTPHAPKEVSGALVKIGGAVAAVGLLAAIGGAVVDHHRFAFAWLTGFTWLTTIGLGALFFVILQYLTKAGWSVGPRRQAEWIAGILPLCALLFIPVLVFSHDIFHHWMGPQAAEDELLRKKAGWLNPTFFYIRAGIYFVIWTLLALKFRKNSLEQDKSGDPKLTNNLESLSPASMVVFALSLTFAAFDWLMSLDPHWFSTIFGVYVFSGSVTSSLAMIALLTIWLQKKGLLHRVSTVEHRHDIGKLLFGFTVFWAYIGFSQFFLIWYANIPEETIYFLHRWEHGWKPVTYLLIFGHFVGPFALLMSRHAKRSMTVLTIGAVWMLFMHWVDMYWMVMPTVGESWHGFHWVDLTGLLLPAGLLVFWIGRRASQDPIYPLQDPRLPEAVQLVNL